ncbi:hypothetical protein [Ancylobacter oerskovii]|uniref:Tail assembly chaperone n=1 Tax=Ancylobacter oerskovii TaxID=459519 RepID=A0ABW4Z106_9HYPH|nr:hypothetical protein [Ancylobacter oerskovii]MBS7542528.1 hypothetical protein [Ancylobacter oerskovii]
MKLSAIKVNTKAIEAGKWVGDIPEMGDLRLKVRGIGNSDFNRRYDELVQAIPRAERPNNRLTPDAQRKLTAQLYAETILLDWEGLTDDDGAPVAFSMEFAEQVLADPEMRDFVFAVRYAAQQVAGETADSNKADAGN